MRDKQFWLCVGYMVCAILLYTIVISFNVGFNVLSNYYLADGRTPWFIQAVCGIILIMHAALTIWAIGLGFYLPKLWRELRS